MEKKDKGQYEEGRTGAELERRRAAIGKNTSPLCNGTWGNGGCKVKRLGPNLEKRRHWLALGVGRLGRQHLNDGAAHRPNV